MQTLVVSNFELKDERIEECICYLSLLGFFLLPFNYSDLAVTKPPKCYSFMGLNFVKDFKDESLAQCFFRKAFSPFIIF